MCVDPATAVMGAGMAAQAAGPVLGAVGEYNQGMAQYKGQRAMTRLRNQQAMTDWAYRKQVQDREWQQTLKIYDLKTKQHTLQVQENTDALYRAYEDGQIQLNNILEASRQQNFDAWRRLMGMQGQATAKGKVGRRANQQDRLNRMEFGIENQRRLSDLTSYSQQNAEQMRRYTRQANNANMRSWYNVSIAPQQTTPIPQPLLEPHTAVRPSMLGVAGGLLEGVGSAATDIAGLMQSPGSLGPSPGGIKPGNFDFKQATGGVQGFGMPQQMMQTNVSPLKAGTMNAFGHLMDGGNPLQGFAMGAAGQLLNSLF